MRARSYRRLRRYAPNILAIDDNEPMTPDQAVLLRQLAIEAYEADAFEERITRLDAELRIALLRAKLTRIGEPPDRL